MESQTIRLVSLRQMHPDGKHLALPRDTGHHSQSSLRLSANRAICLRWICHQGPGLPGQTLKNGTQAGQVAK
ncbi:hypothetical protein CDAR_221701 [Caerostris darwini]|uniref:Uncharacterized protein n=1 Tax=Caerostris darwini TaxID=1538125 RepID=A0AAV4WKU3_9ARAC|nr:hypothetical protein CDAR_221701 [Caerostris darwini]